MEQYDIIGYFGTINLDIAAPYFPISKLLSRDFQGEFLNFININLNNREKTKERETIYTTSKKLLEKYVKYVNPEMAISSIKDFMDDLDFNFNVAKKDNLIDLIVHTGCMINRCIHGDKIKFADIDEFIGNNIKQFKKLRQSIKILENEFEIHINDDEICYIITILNMYNIK